VFYAGPRDGIYDDDMKQALYDFMGWENYDVRIREDALIDTEVLEDIRMKYEEWKSEFWRRTFIATTEERARIHDEVVR